MNAVNVVTYTVREESNNGSSVEQKMAVPANLF